MARISAKVAGLERFFLTQIQRTNQSTLDSALRLTTGKRINSPSDDPSGFQLVTSLERQLNLVASTKSNVDQATTIAAEAQLAVDEARVQLETIRDTLLLGVDEELGAEEIDAYQELIDASVAEVNSLARTEIGGRRYLDGSINYTFTGRDANQVRDIQVYRLASPVTLTGGVTAATATEVRYTGAAGAINSGDATFTLTGRRGSTVISVENGDDLDDVADVINLASHLTGVTAAAAGNDLTLTTVDLGDAATIAVDVTDGTFNTTAVSSGVDAIVFINGRSLSSDQIDGNRVSYTDHGVHLTFEVAAGYSGSLTPITITDSNTARFNLSTDLQRETKLGLPGLQAELLGGVSGRLSDLVSGGDLELSNDTLSAALRVVDESLAQLNLYEARVDSFADVAVASAAALLDEFQTRLNEALETENTTNEDEESVLIARNQTLSANAVSSLSLLTQQNYNILQLLSLLAGV